MSVPLGLESWELVAFSALCVMVYLGTATMIGVSVAYFATREPRAVRQPSAAPVPGTAQPAPAFARTPTAVTP